MCKISICITYYNQENFVKDSLESVLSIDFPCDFEILIGDDGSTDNTVAEIKKFQEKYPDKIKLICNKKSKEQNLIKKASLNRLNLASKANGDYILFLDGDDFYCDNSFIKEALDILDNNTHLSACAFNFKYLYENQTEEIFNQNMKEGIINSKDYLAKEYYSPSGAFVFRNYLSTYKMRRLKEINNFDDNGITVFFIQYGDFCYIDKTIYAYRQQKESNWNKISKPEQILLNAMDYKLLSKTAPKFDKEILKREFPALKYIYKNRKNLKDLIGKNYQEYIDTAEKNNDKFIFRILTWENLNPLKKLKVKYRYQKYKIVAKYLSKKK